MLINAFNSKCIFGQILLKYLPLCLVSQDYVNKSNQMLHPLSPLNLVDEHLVHVVDEELHEGVDVANIGQGELLVSRPGQVGPEHHGQVGGGHLVHVAPVIDKYQELHQVFEDGVVTLRQLFDDKTLAVSQSALPGNV